MAWGETESTLKAVLEQLEDGSEPLTCFAGEDAPLGAMLSAIWAPDGVKVECLDGGQPRTTGG